MAALFIQKEGKKGWINRAFSIIPKPVDSRLDIGGLHYLHNINSALLNFNESHVWLGACPIMQSL